MKKWIVALLCIALTALKPYALADETAVLRAEADRLFAASNDAIWCWKDGSLTRQDASGGEAVEVAQPGGVRQLAAFGENAYCLMGQGNRQHVREISPEGETLAVYPVDAGWHVRQLAADADALYLLAEAGEYARQASGDPELASHASVYRVRREAPDAPERLAAGGWDNEGISCISVRDGLLAAYEGFDPEADASADPQNQLAVVELAAGRLLYAPVQVELCELAINGFCGDALYAYGLYSREYENRLMQVDCSTGAVLAAAEFVPEWEREDDIFTEFRAALPELPERSAGLQRTADAVWTLDVQQGTLASVPASLPDEEEFADALVLVDCDIYQQERFAAAVERFHERYPDMRIVLRRSDCGEKIPRLLEARARGFDVIFTSGMASRPEAVMARQGLLLDLREIPDFDALRGAYLDVFDSFRVGDVQYAAPVQFWGSPWRMDGELAEALSIEMPGADWTWDDLFAMGDAVREYNEANGASVALCREPYWNQSALVTQMNLNAVDWERLEGRYDAAWGELLRKWAALYAEGLITMDDSAKALFRVEDAVMYGDLGSEAWVVPPRLDEERDRCPTIHAARASVAAGSAHRAEAEWFVACLLNPEAVKATPLEEAGQILRDAEGYAPADFTGMVMPGEANCRMWRELVERSAPEQKLGGLYRTQMFELLPRLLAGEISAEEFLRQSQAALDAALAEYR